MTPEPTIVSESITETSGTDCLLVVDDQEANIQVLGATLGKLGFEILPATSGAEALKRLQTRKPDLILLDLILPDMDGFQICQKIQENPDWRDIPVIFLSAADDKNLIVRALESGGVDYITKPFNKPELISRVRTHLMLKTMRDHLKHLAQDREELLGMISHHLQNHLAGMNISAQMLLDRTKENVDGKVRLMAENIRSSSNQMRSFVRAFLANAAADHGLQVKLQPVDFAGVIQKCVAHYFDVAHVKDIELVVNVPTTGNMQVRADDSALGQVLDNLVSNAIKFSPPGKKIYLTLRQRLQLIECEVRDEGPGFTAQDKVRMFHRYARLSARPTAGEPSSGLGLSIVKKLVNAMGGEMVCESEPGLGAVFLVKFPAAVR